MIVMNPNEPDIGSGRWACLVEEWFREVGPVEGWDMRRTRYRFASKPEAEAKAEAINMDAKARKASRRIETYVFPVE